jgi:hypothetical protein
VALRILAALACWLGALGVALGSLLLAGSGLAAANASTTRTAGRAARLQTYLGLASDSEGEALDAAARRHGALTRHGDLPWLRVSGSPYARGFAHGRLLRAGVREQVLGLLHRGTPALVARAAEERAGAGALAGALTFLGSLPVVRDRVREAFLDEVDARLSAHMPRHHVEELLGLADGADLDPQEVRRFHAVAEVSSAGCSNLAAWGRATATGEFIQYRNLDWSLRWRVQRYPLLLEHTPGAGRRGHLTAGFVGFVGALQGVSEAGLTLGEVGAGSRAVTYDGLPLVFRLRRVLEEAGDLGDVDALMAAGDRTKGYNFVIGHIPARRARAYETNRDHVATFDGGDPAEASVPYALPLEDVVIRGDCAVDPTIRAAQHAAGGPGDPRQDYSYRHRYEAVARAAAAAHGTLDLARVETIARAAGDASQNLVSVLYTERALRVSFAQGEVKASARPYIEVPYADVPALGGGSWR